MTRRRLLAFVLMLGLVGAAETGGAVAALRDHSEPPAPQRLAEADFQDALLAYQYLNTQSLNVVGRDALLQGGWDTARTAAKLESDATPRPIEGDASRALRNSLTYIIENNRSRLSSLRLVEAFISGMARVVDDPHTVFIPGSAISGVRGDDEESGGAIYYGVSVEDVDGDQRVWEVLDGSPADRAGLKLGDIVLGTELLTAAEGPQTPITSYDVSMKVKRGSRFFTLVVRPTSDGLPTADVRNLGNDIDYLRIYSFSRPVRDFDAALDAAWDELRGTRIIVDLRTNPGGSIRNVAALAGKLGYKGTMMISLDRNGRRTLTPVGSASSAPYSPHEIIFLVNGGSYSGSEILSAFGQQYGSRVIGTQTSGTSHAAIPLQIGKGILELGVYRNLVGPKAVDIEDIGVTPDESVAIDYERLKKGDDSVIGRAVELLSSSGSR